MHRAQRDVGRVETKSTLLHDKMFDPWGKKITDAKVAKDLCDAHAQLIDVELEVYVQAGVCPAKDIKEAKFHMDRRAKEVCDL